MITITAIAPGFNPTDLPDGIVLKSTDEYVVCYQKIKDAMRATSDLHVAVTDPTSARWLKIMAQRYGPDYITYTELTLRSFLEDRIGLKIPDEISEAEILAARLNELNIPASGQANFFEYLLEIFFGSFLNKTDMVYRVNEIIAAYEPEQWQQALNRPLVKKAYNDRLRQLRASMDTANLSASLPLLTWFEKAPDIYIRNLSALKLLQNYPEALGTRVFGETYSELAKLNLDLRRVPVVIKGNEATLNEIRTFLQLARLEKSSGVIEKLLSQVSGYLEIELDTIRELIQSGNIETSKELIRQIQRKFTALHNQPEIAQVLAELDLLVAVSVPTEPEPNWDVDQWLKWAVEEYLPYRFWLESMGKLDDQIGELAGKYADWLYANYGQLLFNSNRMAWKAVLNLKEKLKAHSGPILIVMADNLNVKFYPLFQRQLQLQGFYEQDGDYCISMLPSFTEVGKKCVITGHYEPFEGTSYAGVVEKTWANRLNKQVRYLANVLELRQTSERSQDVYILNYLPIDLCLHQHESHSGISHNQTIQVYLTVLAQDIRAFARRLGAEQDLMVVIISDHGSTRIPSGTVNVIENQLYKKHALDEHHRFIAIQDTEAEKLSKQIQYDCYLLQRKEFGLPNNYLIARRLYRFLPTNDSVYIHGGLTPEETIIPVAVYLPITVHPKPLNIRLIEPKKVIAGTNPELVFEISNQNNSSVEQITLEIPDANINAPSVTVEEIQKWQRIITRIKAHCPSSIDVRADKLQIRLTYHFNGQEHEQNSEIPIVFGNLLQVKFDLDNL